MALIERRSCASAVAIPHRSDWITRTRSPRGILWLETQLLPNVLTVGLAISDNSVSIKILFSTGTRPA